MREARGAVVPKKCDKMRWFRPHHPAHDGPSRAPTARPRPRPRLGPAGFGAGHHFSRECPKRPLLAPRHIALTACCSFLWLRQGLCSGGRFLRAGVLFSCTVSLPFAHTTAHANAPVSRVSKFLTSRMRMRSSQFGFWTLDAPRPTRTSWATWNSRVCAVRRRNAREFFDILFVGGEIELRLVRCAPHPPLARALSRSFDCC